MLSKLKSLKPNRPKKTDKSKKILCILEGNLELEYIVKIFKIFGYQDDCYKLSETIIRVAWGKKAPKNKNIIKKTKKGCTFEGGSHKGSKVPFPAIEAFELYSRDLELFNSVIVLFDGDKDKENKVESYFIKKFKSLKVENILLVSIPCFESTLIDFCTCGNCRVSIQKLVENREVCEEYKKGLACLKCFKQLRTGKGIVSI